MSKLVMLCQTDEISGTGFENSSSFLSNYRKVPQLSKVSKNCQIVETLRTNVETFMFPSTIHDSVANVDTLTKTFVSPGIQNLRKLSSLPNTLTKTYRSTSLLVIIHVGTLPFRELPVRYLVISPNNVVTIYSSILYLFHFSYGKEHYEYVFFY